MYEGRKEDVYPVPAEANGVFCMVIKGVFEVNGRLLHPHDAVIFCSDKEIDFEALANQSILLIIETV